MSDVKKFTGYLAIDQSTHKTQAAAVAHSREVKIKTALNESFKPDSIALGGVCISTDEAGNPVIYPDDVANFIYANSEAILKALNQDVLLRKKRTLKAAKVEAATA